MFNKVLVANRGEIACRIIRSLKKMGVASVAVYSEADAYSQHVTDADEAYCIGGAQAAESYLVGENILAIAKKTGAQAIHPGYGFLSENSSFCERCEQEGVRFIGPTISQMEDFGLKHRSRELAEQFGVPLVPGSSLLDSAEMALAEADRIGYPVMLKSSAGGGGIGMALCRDDKDISENFERIKRLGENNFNDGAVFLEKCIEHARHVEVQVFGDGKGKALILGDRDCSVQRRNQKVIEETPAPNLPDSVREKLHSSAKRLVEGVAYRSAGTVEFVYDNDTQQFYFLEVNTRLQVEHCVTEEIYGVDLVEWMIRLAAGDLDDLDTMQCAANGAAIEVRLYAEDPGKNYQPSTGVLTEVVFPEDVRLESWVTAGTEVSAFYDPLLAKLIVHAKNREEAVKKLRKALDESSLSGLETNLILLRQLAASQPFVVGDYTTRMADKITYSAPTFTVLRPGMQTTVQDFPGRTGYWAVGVPPSGPMDSLSHRLANRVVGNSEEAACLEITASGPEIEFNTDCLIGVTGADFKTTLDGERVALYTPIAVKAGMVLKFGVSITGQRGYLAVRGGIDVPLYLGSRSTFTLGQFGGHGGRVLKSGDVLHIDSLIAGAPMSLDAEEQPQLTSRWEIAVLYGPHGAPDFFDTEDIETLFSTDYEVHYNSSRTGVRLIGPAPRWAREDGGEAGLHPSNIHDNAYAIGTLDFTGDMPVILGPDGPSLGGFVCPVTIVAGELWKIGQLRPGDKVRFMQVNLETAIRIEQVQEELIEQFQTKTSVQLPEDMRPENDSPIVYTYEVEGETRVFRRAGDKYLLIEFGELVLDLRLRFAVHTLMLELERLAPEGIIDITPGIRSLQIHYDNRVLPLEKLIALAVQAEKNAAGKGKRKVPARIVHLPLSWDDEATHKAIEKYTQSVRADAPWCPSNIEFIRRINGLDSVEDVKKILFSAKYLVMGLGDVYLGAPVATPVDPRNRLVTTKYNPARTWTAENSVGIGGAYLCVYGMEGPGGYQFVGRTIQMWNRYNVTREFEEGKPWLLRFFDQIRFYPVSHDELTQMRKDFPAGQVGLKIEETEFDLDEYEKFLEENRESIQQFKSRQQNAFEAERQDWIEKGLLNFQADDSHAGDADSEATVLAGCEPIESEVAGSLWKVLVSEGQSVAKGETVAIIECMKMEFNLMAHCEGTVKQLFCAEGDVVASGQQLLAIDPA
ncbi:urea carboxylase [Desulfogranum japonicum]|uniref:urea carboxylase n=1 Tax=Desulfogranum japonicum TaxID=231447 RepID=UPI0003F50F5B|nr:urea carboxylase [Desulfogranum japonicum]